ncbi:MAG: siroheme synthase [Synergistales bacterium]|nr:siroheme synthase [Synergistales bacterium]
MPPIGRKDPKERRDFPLMISLSPRSGPILVVGGGPTALRKVETLLQAGMAVRLVASAIRPEIERLAAEGRLTRAGRAVEREDFRRHAFAVIAASRDDTEAIVPLAEGTGCLLNCCGAPERSDWALAAQFSHGGYRIGVSSRGTDPAGAAAVKGRLMEMAEQWDHR